MNEETPVNSEITLQEINASTVEATPFCSAAQVSRPLHESFAAKAGMMIFPCIFMVIWLVVVIFVLLMIYRLVRAVEKIAAKIESGVAVKKQDS